MDLMSKTEAHSNELPKSEPVSHSQQPNNSPFALFPIFLLYFTFSFGLAAYNSRKSPCHLAFVISSHVQFILVLLSLKMHENLATDDAASSAYKHRLKVVAWILCTFLACTVAWKISQFVPWYFNIMIWGMSAYVSLVQFYFFFLFRDDDSQLTNNYCKLKSDDKEEKEFRKPTDAKLMFAISLISVMSVITITAYVL
ncbi:hypothetical protein LUZ61_012914 [Rhynchospora tenuis]|uniref:Uncharacterized protein n=1 Tax=Rhynchospora tenuis TaxID=198213 RepID=A0AAD6A3U9_9POAL|nr:hypothetical protein LUZ61_012912 [Rhynchospora tenuis]KAJ3709208.1 hypothetical protein LUZ61_012913 [Rhynchospora tenuis]KAJ3709209.1 hypothetical protein LUZ61_012914 [Rhynchospora tenuis]